MSIAGDKGENEAENIQTPSILVAFNSAAAPQQFEFAQAEKYQLHPVMQNSVDPIVKNSSIEANLISIPALTTAVFIKNME